jgi:hypothetical protein
MTPFADPAVAAKFADFPAPARAGLMALRQMIFDIAADTPGVGPVHETLKWGQPSYLTPTTKSGSTIRLGIPKQGGFAVYTHCQTTLMADFQSIAPGDLTFDGTRGVLFADTQSPPDAIALLIRNALTYHLK